jgi:hypothetical protein
LSFVNRRAARAALARVLAWPIERVVIAHGVLPTAGGAAFVRRAFAWLLRLDRGAERPSDNQHLVPSRLWWHAARVANAETRAAISDSVVAELLAALNVG